MCHGPRGLSGVYSLLFPSLLFLSLVFFSFLLKDNCGEASWPALQPTTRAPPAWQRHHDRTALAAAALTLSATIQHLAQCRASPFFLQGKRNLFAAAIVYQALNIHASLKLSRTTSRLDGLDGSKTSDQKRLRHEWLQKPYLNGIQRIQAFEAIRSKNEQLFPIKQTKEPV